LISVDKLIGGYLAIQVALSHPAAIRAVIATYPMIDLRDPFYCRDYNKNIAHQPQYEMEIIDNHIETLPHGNHPSSRNIISSTDALAYTIIQRGRFVEFLGDDRRLFPLDRLEDDAQLANEFPYLWLQHGTADTGVPIGGSRKFVSKLKILNPQIAVRYSELEGMDHGLPSEVYLIKSGEWSGGIKIVNEMLNR